jgi:hypothetical protein
MREGAINVTLNVDFAAGGIVREVRIYDEVDREQ